MVVRGDQGYTVIELHSMGAYRRSRDSACLEGFFLFAAGNSSVEVWSWSVWGHRVSQKTLQGSHLACLFCAIQDESSEKRSGPGIASVQPTR